MRWEFSSMMTVAIMLILLGISGQIEALLTNPWINIFPGIGFLIAGIIGGLITDYNYKKAILTVAISYIAIGLLNALSLSISCQDIDCIFVTLTLLGIPVGTILSSLGIFIGYQIKEKKLILIDE